MDGAAPDVVEVAESFGGVREVKVDAFVAVKEVEFAPVGIVAVHDVDDGLAKVG
jgi:hypothetical protein